jgi:hypothetical protein
MKIKTAKIPEKKPIVIKKTIKEDIKEAFNKRLKERKKQ